MLQQTSWSTDGVMKAVHTTRTKIACHDKKIILM